MVLNRHVLVNKLRLKIVCIVDVPYIALIYAGVRPIRADNVDDDIDVILLDILHFLCLLKRNLLLIFSLVAYEGRKVEFILLSCRRLDVLRWNVVIAVYVAKMRLYLLLERFGKVSHRDGGNALHDRMWCGELLHNPKVIA